MQERQVTIGRETFQVPNPFLVLATQNPIETEGTYALPEAQVDRFMLKVLVGYPSATEEFVIVERMTGMLQAVQKVLTTDAAAGLAASGRQGVRGPGADRVRHPHGRARPAPPKDGRPERIAALHHVRRQPARLDQPDPRGAGAGLRARARRMRCRRMCWIWSLDVMRHRLVLSYEALSDNVTSDDLLNKILEPHSGAGGALT